MIDRTPDRYEVAALSLWRGNVRFDALPDDLRGDPGFLIFLLRNWGDRFIRRFDSLPERVRTDRALLETLLRTRGDCCGSSRRT